MTHRHLEHVRTVARAVAGSTRHVWIDQRALATEASALARSTSAPAEPPATPGFELEERLSFLVTRATIRFGAAWLEPETLESRVDALVRRWFERDGPASASSLAAVEFAGLQTLAGAPAPAVELLDLWARALHDLGRLLAERHGGRFSNLAEAAGDSAEGWIEALIALPYFRDVQRYRGIAVPFFARAQRLAAEIGREISTRGGGDLRDRSTLVLGSDSRTIGALRDAQVLRCAAPVEERLDRAEPIPAHSEREVELRAVAVHAIEELARAAGTGSSAAHERLLAAHPATAALGPRTRSVYY